MSQVLVVECTLKVDGAFFRMSKFALFLLPVFLILPRYSIFGVTNINLAIISAGGERCAAAEAEFSFHCFLLLCWCGRCTQEEQSDSKLFGTKMGSIIRVVRWRSGPICHPNAATTAKLPRGCLLAWRWT